MNHEVVNQIIKSAENLLTSKHGPFYAGLAAITSVTIGYVLIDNKYGISVGSDSVKPCLEQEQAHIEEK